MEPGSRQARKEQTRRAILDAALRLSTDNGLATLSLRRVAKEVGIVPTAFYRHFDSVEQLGLALVEDSFASLREMLRDVRRRHLEIGEIIPTSVEVLIEHVRQQRAHFGFIARERTGGPPDVRGAIRRQLDLFARELATDLARLPGTDRWTTEDLDTLSELIVGAMVATAEKIVDGEPEAQVAATARTQLRMLVIGALNWRSD